MTTYANPFTPEGSEAWQEWEKNGNKSIAPEHQGLVDAANDAYDRQDQGWFFAQSTDALVTLWNLVAGINMFTPAGPFDDEVYDALDARGWFDAQARAARDAAIG